MAADNQDGSVSLGEEAWIYITEDKIGLLITIIYYLVYLFVFIVISIVAAVNVANDNNVSFCCCCCAWCKYVWKQKKTLSPIFAHLFDTATDIGALVEYYLLWQANDTSGAFDWQLIFIASLSIIIFHRLFSAFTMVFTTKRPIDFFLQLFDVLIFKIIYNARNYGKTSFLERDLMVLETCLEAAPQMIISLAIILKTGNPSSIVIISIVGSFFQLVSTIRAHDKHRTSNSYGCCDRFNFYSAMFMWRVFEMTARIITLTLIWLILGFIPFIVILVIDITISLYSFYKLRKLEALTQLIYIMNYSTSCKSIFWWRWFELVVHLLLITTGLFLFEYKFPVEYEKKFDKWEDLTYIKDEIYGSLSITYIFLMYSYVAVLVYPCLAFCVRSPIRGTAGKVMDMIQFKLVDKCRDMIEQKLTIQWGDWEYCMGVIAMFRGHQIYYNENGTKDLWRYFLHHGQRIRDEYPGFLIIPWSELLEFYLLAAVGVEPRKISVDEFMSIYFDLVPEHDFNTIPPQRIHQILFLIIVTCGQEKWGNEAERKMSKWHQVDIKEYMNRFRDFCTSVPHFMDDSPILERYPKSLGIDIEKVIYPSMAHNIFWKYWQFYYLADHQKWEFASYGLSQFLEGLSDSVAGDLIRYKTIKTSTKTVKYIHNIL